MSSENNFARLDVILREACEASRNETRELIREGKILVNGLPAGSAAMLCSSDDTIEISGRRVGRRKKITLMMNKPAGCVSTASDPYYPSVLSLLSGSEFESHALFVVGRLDEDTTGLLLLTNDGELCDRIIRPESGLSKTYLASLDRDLPDSAESVLEEGVILQGGIKCRPAHLKRITDRLVEITVTEGKYHEVKRLIHACGARVGKLKRLSIGGLRLDESLAEGEFRLLTEEDVCKIFE